jgi:hypothetical protein
MKMKVVALEKPKQKSSKFFINHTNKNTGWAPVDLSLPSPLSTLIYYFSMQ